MNATTASLLRMNVTAATSCISTTDTTTTTNHYELIRYQAYARYTAALQISLTEMTASLSLVLIVSDTAALQLVALTDHCSIKMQNTAVRSNSCACVSALNCSVLLFASKEW
jgi:hypothetical protein